MELTNTAKFNSDSQQIDGYTEGIKQRSDQMMNYFLIGYFVIGILLATFYDTYFVALTVGGLSLAAYYISKWTLRESDLYQYVASGVMGIFMAQYIFQMHGLFEMHFIAFISSAILITYQNWKLQFPLTIVVVLHHAVFGYLQYIGNKEVFFTQLSYMDLQTFIIHVLLAAAIFFICGLWAYQMKKFSSRHIEQAYAVARLEEAELQKNALLKANQELDKFVYSVSHDLRAPLSSMKGVIEITEEETTDEFIIQNLKLVKGSVQKLDDFIQDILEYSRNSRLEVKKQDIDFNDILSEITNNLKYMDSNNSDHRVSISYKINNAIPFKSDKSRISILLNNLISNAIRYQNPKSENPLVDVNINMSDNSTGIIVKDNGIGISKENHKKIFEMFYRVSENSVGSGLGLYLVKEIVDKLEGKIEIDSEVGIGTTFMINLPNKLSQTEIEA